MSQMEWTQNPIGFGSLTVSSTAVGLDAASDALPSRCHRALITCATDAVRWRSDGTDPTSSVGHVLAKDDSISFTGADYKKFLAAIKFIRVTTDATLSITYFD